MISNSRISSILKSTALDTSITGFPTFSLSDLELTNDLDFPLPTNVRLGHLAEKVVSELIKSSSNFVVLFENIQVLDGKTTIGELDFILQETQTNKLIHMELAYKFYLYDPKISSQQIENWIGPNRNDSLALKLKKLKQKQFPLLHHPCTKQSLISIDINKVQQALCLLVLLFIPFEYKEKLNASYQKAIKGYYVNYEQFKRSDSSEKTYYLPHRKKWGIDPSENETWAEYNDIKEYVNSSLREEQALLIWQKEGNSYTEFFVVWW